MVTRLLTSVLIGAVLAAGGTGASAERVGGRATVTIVDGASVRAAGAELKREMRVETTRHYQQREADRMRDGITAGPEVPVILAEFE